MKKFLFIVAVSMAAVSCATSEIDSNLNLKEEEKVATDIMTVTATFADIDTGTKTTLGEEGKVTWSAGDKIRIFNSSHNSGSVFTIKTESIGSNVGKFEGEDIGEGPYYAIYPAIEGASLNGTDIEFTVPSSQTYSQNSFGNGANIAVGKSTSKDNIPFMNLCGLLVLSITGDTQVKQINLTADDGASLNGPAKVSMNYDGVPALSFTGKTVTAENKAITLNCNGASLQSTAKEFCFVVPAGTMAGGFTVEIVDKDDGCMIKQAKSSEKNEVLRSKITEMPTFGYTREYNSALQKTDCAFYSGVMASSTQKMEAVISDDSQYGLINNSSKVAFRIQNWDDGYSVEISIPEELPAVGESFQMGIKAYGNTNLNSVSKVSATVIKEKGGTAWILDKNGNCFAIDKSLL